MNGQQKPLAQYAVEVQVHGLPHWSWSRRGSRNATCQPETVTDQQIIKTFFIWGIWGACPTKPEALQPGAWSLGACSLEPGAWQSAAWSLGGADF